MVIFLEPISSTVPKVSSKSKYDVIEYSERSTLSLLCPAQGFPAPNFRADKFASAHPFLRCEEHNYRKTLNAWGDSVVSGSRVSHTIVQPVGTRAPKLTQADANFKVAFRPAGLNVPILCQAQGFPVPSFRAPKLTQADSKLKSVERESGFDVPVLCQAQGFPVPSFSIQRKGSLDHTLSKYLVFFHVEPVGSRAPSFSTESEVYTMKRPTGTTLALLCPAQGFPSPFFNPNLSSSRISYSQIQVRCLLGVVFNEAHVLPEPVGSRRPALSSESDISSLKRAQGVNVALLCPAQGFPKPGYNIPGQNGRHLGLFACLEPVGSRAPSFSFESQILIIKRPRGSTFALLCPAQAFPTPTFKSSGITCVEPISSKAPTFATESKGFIRVFDKELGKSFALLCPAQGQPTPIFSGLALFIKILLEPTGKIAPKVPGQKYDGGKIYLTALNLTTVLTCEVVGYPVPAFSKSWFQWEGILSQHAEPTNNVAPKKVGAEFGGWRVLNVNSNGTAWLTCQVSGFPVPKFLSKGSPSLRTTLRRRAFLEPTSNVSPKKDLAKFEGWQVLQVPQTGVAWLTCQVTGYPVPRYFPLNALEPTNNVPPKKDGEQFEGWKVILTPQSSVAWLTCQVTGYPVPRYLLCLYNTGSAPYMLLLALESPTKLYVGFNISMKFAEPTNNVAPKSTIRKYGGNVYQETNNGSDIIMPCDVSGFPLPKFRSLSQNQSCQNIYMYVLEPTNNVAPKAAGRKIDGSIVLEMAYLKDIVIPCDVTAYPVPKFRWYKFIEGTSRKQAVTLNDRVKQVAGTLIIREAKVEDSGKYLCVVNNSVGGESVETVLTVTAPLKASIEPKVQTVDFGRPAVFTCKFEGNPIKTVSWLKDGSKMEHTDAVLRIDAVRKEDKGMYQCFIRNDQESAEATGELKLGGRFEPPQIRHAFNEETVQPGNSVFLKCIASGNPTPEITWELYGRRLSNNDRFQIGQYVTVNGDIVSHLNITGIHTNDGGLYRCNANSKVGSADHSARINVYGLPFVRSMEKQAIVAGGTLIVHCPFAGHPVDTVVWERGKEFDTKHNSFRTDFPTVSEESF
ncbi:hypothetical protein YQE_07594, partial [Dendroctonus ponderosae]